jgi:Uri superfamily endonuclease
VPKPINSGIYVLELFVTKGFNLHHNSLGKLLIPKGYYYYVGSAQKNLTQRIERHLKKYKKQHWHIDYLTCDNNITINNVYLLRDYSKKYECTLVNDLISKYDLHVIIKGFGNTDCNSCESHLLFSKKQLAYSQFCSLYQDTVLFMPSSKDIC